MTQKMRQSMLFPDPPAVAGFGSVAGKKEAEGPLAGGFDLHQTVGVGNGREQKEVGA